MVGNQIDVSSGAQRVERYYFLITFWGEEFVDLTCRLALASLLAPNNIPGMRARESSRFLFCAPRQDWDNLQSRPIFRRLAQHIAVELIENDEAFPGEHKYHRMSRGHALLTERSFQDRAIAININPDSIYPDGSIAEAQRLAASGKKVVLCTAIRFDLEGVEGELRASGKMPQSGPIIVSKREAVDIGLRNLHPESQASDWKASNFGRLHPHHARCHFLTCCFWKTRNADAAVIITHNWSPFLIDFTSLKKHDVGALDGRALDGNYIFENFSTDGIGERIHVIDDSDSLFLLGLTPGGEMVPPSDQFWWKNAPIVGSWTRGYILNKTVFDPGIDELRRRIYTVPVQWHAHDPSAELRRLKRRAVGLITKYVAHPPSRGKGLIDRLRARWFEYVAPFVANS
jgi:hypothetical protein